MGNSVVVKSSSEDITTQGGAIYTTKDLNIIADNGQSVFRGNYTEENGKRDDNAIYADQGAAVNFEVKNNGRIDLYDNIRGASAEITETDDNGNETKYIKKLFRQHYRRWLRYLRHV